MTNEKIPQVEDVANYIIQLANENQEEYFWCSEWITHLKLQKMLYFVQAAFLSNLNKKAFDEKIMAYQYWPVVESIYQKYKLMKRLPLDVEDWWSDDCLSDGDKKAIKRVREIFWWYSSSRLVEMTHQHDPWRLTNQSEEIDVDKIKEYYTWRIIL
jgi:uncharacterized phage-associated protein